MNEGISLTSAAHPRAPWYKRLWHWVSLRRLHPSTLETIEIDVAFAVRQNRNILNNVIGTNMNDNEIEKEIAAKGLNAPRVSVANIEAVIAYEYYITGDVLDDEATCVLGLAHNSVRSPQVTLSCLTLCVLVLANGFTVTGESACASLENFNAELGRKFARQKAIDKVWAFEGYALKERLSRG